MHLAAYIAGCAFIVATKQRHLFHQLQVSNSLEAQPEGPQIPSVEIASVIPTKNHEGTSEDTTKSVYMAHNAPKSTYLLLNSPAIASFVLVPGWSSDSLKKFTNAVNKVVLENPVLSGRATCPKNWWKDPQIGIEMGEFLPSKGHSFVETIDCTNLPSPQLGAHKQEGITDTGFLLDYIDRHVAPLVGPHDSTLQQIHSKSPLFGATVVLLPDNWACIYTKMSHSIGDFVTYYEILDQIASFDKGEDKVHPINWDNPLKAKHEIFPEEFSNRDFNRLYGLPFLHGISAHMPTMFLRKKKYLLLNKDKIKAKKAELNAKGCKGITSNDIIMAALCDANRSSDIFAFTRSMRGITPGLGLRDGGNLHCEIPFQRCAGRNALVIKDMIEKGRYFEPNEVPLWAPLTGKVGRISNCVAPISRMSFGGCKPVCFCSSKGFLDFTPLDVAIIFRASEDQDAVLHNFWRMGQSEHLSEILDTNE